MSLQNKTTRFSVNKEKHTVTCIVNVNACIVSDILNKYLAASGLDYADPAYSFLNKPFIGIAKCHPLDKWDEEVGKKLARERAEEKARNTINLALAQYAERLRHAADLIDKYGVKE